MTVVLLLELVKVCVVDDREVRAISSEVLPSESVRVAVVEGMPPEEADPPTLVICSTYSPLELVMISVPAEAPETVVVDTGVRVTWT